MKAIRDMNFCRCFGNLWVAIDRSRQWRSDWRWSVKKLIKSKLARRIMRGKSKSQISPPKGAKDLARAIFAVADKKLLTKTKQTRSVKDH